MILEHGSIQERSDRRLEGTQWHLVPQVKARREKEAEKEKEEMSEVAGSESRVIPGACESTEIQMCIYTARGGKTLDVMRLQLQLISSPCNGQGSWPCNGQPASPAAARSQTCPTCLLVPTFILVFVGFRALPKQLSGQAFALSSVNPTPPLLSLLYQKLLSKSTALKAANRYNLKATIASFQRMQQQEATSACQCMQPTQTE